MDQWTRVTLHNYDGTASCGQASDDLIQAVQFAMQTVIRFPLEGPGIGPMDVLIQDLRIERRFIDATTFGNSSHTYLASPTCELEIDFIICP